MGLREIKPSTPIKCRTEESSEKRTFEKYVEIARQMRLIGSTALDIRNLSPHEAYIVTALVKEDAIFNFFDECKDIDVRKLFYAVEMLEAEKKYKESM